MNGFLSIAYRGLEELWRMPFVCFALDLDLCNTMQTMQDCLTPHNFLFTRKDNYLSPGCMDNEDQFGNATPGYWRSQIGGEVCDLRSDQSATPSTTQAREVHDNLKDYSFQEGAVCFQ